MTTEGDLLASCCVGALYRTRDRRAVRIERIEPENGLIFGQVEMHGACAWRSDGRYSEAPFGAPGPLDLMPPGEEAVSARRTASIKEALQQDNRPFCCD
jgi:hypothetical protein